MLNTSPAVANPSSQVVTHDRAGFGHVMAQLNERAQDLDLVKLWDELPFPDRRLLLKSAGLENDPSRAALDALNATERAAVRAAIHRMSGYATALQDRLTGTRPHPSIELASHARKALADGDSEEALHWLSLIERGVTQ